MARFSSLRYLVLTAVLVLGVLFTAGPGAAQNDSFIQVSSVPTEAMACLDHYTCNLTPAIFTTTPNSYHALSLYKDGYLSYTSQSVLTGPAGGITSIVVTLAQVPSQTSSLEISSDPSDADIWLDNLYYGTTPQVIGGLSAGIHTLLLRKAGYSDHTEALMIPPGGVTVRDLALTLYPLQPAYGDIRIRSVPAGAAVYVNNNYEGSTLSPSGLYITQLSPGSYPVRITLQGYQPYTETATVTDGGTYDIAANLVPNIPGPTPGTRGQLTVGSNPQGANIFLDNGFRGLTPLTLVDIPAGTHTILLRLNGYQDWQSSVSVTAGGSTAVAGVLAPAITPSPTPAGTPLMPIPTRSPVTVTSILAAIVICGAVAVAIRKRR